MTHIKIITRCLPVLALVATLFISGMATPTESSAQGLFKRKKCPSCNEEVCQLKREQGKEERTCFEIDYKTICIPKVTFPWQDCCAPKCGEARSVKVLKKKTYECPKCKFTWEVVPCDAPLYVDPNAQTSPSDVPIYSQGQPPIITNGIWNQGNRATIVPQPGIIPQPSHQINQQTPNYIVPKVPTAPAAIQNEYFQNPRK